MADNRERFERELHWLRGYRFKRLLVIGAEANILNGQYRFGHFNPRAVMATLYAFEVRYDVPVVFAATTMAGAKTVLSRFWTASQRTRKKTPILSKSVGNHDPLTGVSVRRDRFSFTEVHHQHPRLITSIRTSFRAPKARTDLRPASHLFQAPKPDRTELPTTPILATDPELMSEPWQDNR
jgi:hypothetical protein